MDKITIAGNDILGRVFGSGHMSGLISILSTLLNFFLGFAAITAILALIINVTKWGRAGDNPDGREEAKRNIAICGVCLILLGGFSSLYALVLLLMF